MALPKIKVFPETKKFRADGHSLVYYAQKNKKMLNWVVFVLILVGTLALLKFFSDWLGYPIPNWLFILSVVGVLLGIYLMHRYSGAKGEKVHLAFKEEGLFINRDFYSYNKIVGFSMIPRDKITTFFLQTNIRFKPYLIINVDSAKSKSVSQFLQSKFPYQEPPLFELFLEKLSSWLSF